MAKRGKKANSNELDGKEFFDAIAEIEEKKKIKQGYMLEKIETALLSAYRKDHEGVGENLTVEMDPQAGIVRMILRKEVVEEVENPGMQIALSEARESLPNADVGDVVRLDIKPKNFGRIAAQAARQVIIQGIREAEQGMAYEELNSKEHEIWTGVITRIDQRTGAVVVQLGSGSDTTDAYLAVGEQVNGEKYVEGERLKVYVVEVRRGVKGPQMLISRTHPGLVKRLFELEVPEIFEGTVEIKSIAREAGARTKIAVWSSDDNVDPVGACVGSRGVRVNTIIEELHGEKIDIIKYNDDITKYIASALAPSDVISVSTMDEGKRCRVIVPDDQLSLAIGKEGQNARLAAKLTSCKIDIKPKSSLEELAVEEEIEAVSGEYQENVQESDRISETSSEVEMTEDVVTESDVTEEVATESEMTEEVATESEMTEEVETESEMTEEVDDSEVMETI